jgi:hypothetical protein
MRDFKVSTSHKKSVLPSQTKSLNVLQREETLGKGSSLEPKDVSNFINN